MNDYLGLKVSADYHPSSSLFVEIKGKKEDEMERNNLQSAEHSFKTAVFFFYSEKLKQTNDHLLIHCKVENKDIQESVCLQLDASEQSEAGSLGLAQHTFFIPLSLIHNNLNKKNLCKCNFELVFIMCVLHHLKNSTRTC